MSKMSKKERLEYEDCVIDIARRTDSYGLQTIANLCGIDTSEFDADADDIESEDKLFEDVVEAVKTMQTKDLQGIVDALSESGLIHQC
jgi:hypothetical protein